MKEMNEAEILERKQFLALQAFYLKVRELVKDLEMKLGISEGSQPILLSLEIKDQGHSQGDRG